jgi:hypothetical protein
LKNYCADSDARKPRVKLFSLALFFSESFYFKLIFLFLAFVRQLLSQNLHQALNWGGGVLLFSLLQGCSSGLAVISHKDNFLFVREDSINSVPSLIEAMHTSEEG